MCAEQYTHYSRTVALNVRDGFRPRLSPPSAFAVIPHLHSPAIALTLHFLLRGSVSPWWMLAWLLPFTSPAHPLTLFSVPLCLCGGFWLLLHFTGGCWVLLHFTA